MKYIHYKGGEYEFIGIGRDVATLEPVVIYKSCTTGELWVRSEVAFFGTVATVEGNGSRRFIPAPPEPK